MDRIQATIGDAHQEYGHTTKPNGSRPQLLVQGQKDEFTTIVTRIIDRAVAAKAVRSDLTIADFPLLTGGIMSTMYVKPAGNDHWHRHLETLLTGIRTPTERCGIAK